MIQRVWFVVFVLAAMLLIGCASTAPAPSAPQNSAAPAVAPAAGQAPLALPPQPTSAPKPAGAAVPYQTAVPALIVVGPTLVPKAAAGAPAAPVAVAAVAPAAAAPAAPPKAVAQAPGVATGKKTDAKFLFNPALATIEDAEPLDAAIKTIKGVFECSSSQTSTIVTYDAGLVTPDQIAQAFAIQGHPVTAQ